MDYNKTNASKIYEKLCTVFTPSAVIGIMANLYAESGFMPNNLQNSCAKRMGVTDEQYTFAVNNGSYTNFVHDSCGYGLCQWTYWSRKQGLLDYAGGKSIDDIDMQLDFMLVELKAKKSLYSFLQTSNSVEECSRQFMLQFERPADQSTAAQEKRIGYAVELEKDFKVVKNVIIALDAGHGLYTSGKRITLDGYASTREWELNDRIIDMVEKDLSENYKCTVLRVDDTTGKKDISLSARVSMANKANADVYLSMHHNAGINGGSGGGTVVYYYSSKSERKEQAQKLYNYITDETKLYGNRSQRVIKNGFYVIKKTKMPAFLVENGFMDSTTDVPIIISEEHAIKTAKGVIAFLVEQFSIEPKKVSEIDDNKATEVYYPRYSGVKTTLSNAMNSLGLDSSYNHRKLIAKANGISGYVGTAAQNTKIYNLLVAGLLKRE